MISEFHERLYTHLISNHADKRFTLRATNQKERLAMGYWFLGNEYSLMFSFWDAQDFFNKTPSIYLTVNPEGELTLNFSAKDSEEKFKALEYMALLLDMKQIIIKKGEAIPAWNKRYEKKDKGNPFEFIHLIDVFMKGDFYKIEALLKKNPKDDELFPLIPENKFRKNKAIVEGFRSRLITNNETPNTPILPDVQVPEPQIKLNTFSFAGLKNLQDDTISFNDKNVICIIGENGSGKSTLLRAIAITLSGISPFSPEHSALQKMMRIERINGSKVLADSTELHLSYQFDGTPVNNKVRWLQNRDHDTNSKAYHAIENVLGSDDSDAFLMNDEDSPSILKHLVIGFSQQTKGDTVAQSKSVSQLPDADDDLGNLVYGIEDDRFQKFHQWMLEFLERKIESDTELVDKVIARIFEVLRLVTGDEQLLFDAKHSRSSTGEIVVRTNQNPNGVPMTLTSQGYNNVIGWVGWFMKRLWEVWSLSRNPNKSANFYEHPSICLIDEIDTYLHPKWQQTILKTLAETFPNTQFIVTTHSPIVLGSLSKKNSIILKLNVGGGIEYEEGQLGKDTNYILVTQMDVSELDTDANKKITDYLDTILNADFSNEDDLAKFRAMKSSLIEEYGPEFNRYIQAEQLIRHKALALEKRLINQ